MHLRREIADLLDYIIEEKEKLGKDKTKDQKILDEIKEIKAEIRKLTFEGERAKGLWTESPEFICKAIFG